MSMCRRVRGPNSVGGYIGANLSAQGAALGQQAISQLGLKAGDKAIVFGAWGQPGRYLREEGTAKALGAGRADCHAYRVTTCRCLRPQPAHTHPLQRLQRGQR